MDVAGRRLQTGSSTTAGKMPFAHRAVSSSNGVNSLSSKDIVGQPGTQGALSVYALKEDLIRTSSLCPKPVGQLTSALRTHLGCDPDRLFNEQMWASMVDRS